METGIPDPPARPLTILRTGKPGRPKGYPRSGGRKKGTLNHATVDAREAASEIVDSPEYRENLRKRAISGDLSPAVETMLWGYSKGRPVERVETGRPGDFAGLSDEELAERLAAVRGQLIGNLRKA